MFNIPVISLLFAVIYGSNYEPVHGNTQRFPSSLHIPGSNSRCLRHNERQILHSLVQEPSVLANIAQPIKKTRVYSLPQLMAVRSLEKREGA